MSHNVWDWVNSLSDEEIADMPPWARLSSENSEYKNCVPGQFADPDIVFEVSHKKNVVEIIKIKGPPEKLKPHGIGWESTNIASCSPYNDPYPHTVYDSNVDLWYKKTYNKKRTAARKKLGYVKKDTKAFLKITQRQLELKVKVSYLLQDSVAELKRLNKQITSEEGFTQADYRAYIDLGRNMERGIAHIKKLYKSVERTNF